MSTLQSLLAPSRRKPATSVQASGSNQAAQCPATHSTQDQRRADQDCGLNSQALVAGSELRWLKGRETPRVPPRVTLKLQRAQRGAPQGVCRHSILYPEGTSTCPPDQMGKDKVISVSENLVARARTFPCSRRWGRGLRKGPQDALPPPAGCPWSRTGVNPGGHSVDRPEGLYPSESQTRCAWDSMSCISCPFVLGGN